jgi:enediyne biosynthesis protein E4
MGNNRIVSFSLLIMLLLAALFACRNKTVVFADVTEKAGIGFKYTYGDFSYKNIMESSGGGITVFDYNNDGLMDLYFMNGTYLEGISDAGGKTFSKSHNELYRNNGDGTFTEVSEKAGVALNRWSMAAGAIDLDNDGFQDLYVLNYGPNVFFHNNGNGTFTDITGSLCLSGPEELNGFPKWSIGVSFWDYNGDQRMDAMVGNFMAFDPAYQNPQTPGMMPSPVEYMGQASLLYEQQPDGKFKDVTVTNNLFFPDSRCMGLTVLDYDDDGDLDIFQANDHQLNFLFRNDSGVYKEVGISAGVAANSKGVGTGSMHASPGDFNNDGLTDILVTDLSFGALCQNSGNGVFRDVTESGGVAAAMDGKGGWGGSFLDYDNDGDLDMVAANGTAEELILQYPLLLENDGTGRFTDAGKQHGTYFRTKHSGRGLAIADFDNDGDPDVVVSHLDNSGIPALLRNEGGNRNHWLGLILEGENGPAAAIGAKVTVTSGGKKRAFVNQWTCSYLSNNDPRMLIGLGQEESVEQLEIRWSNGKTEIYHHIPVNRYLTIKEGKATVGKTQGTGQSNR